MTYTLAKGVKVGQQIKVTQGWRTVEDVDEEGVVYDDVDEEGAWAGSGVVLFGEIIYGWKEVCHHHNKRHYFEIGCLCLINNVMKRLPPSVSDKEAGEYYYENCECSRNYKHLEEDERMERGY